MAVFPNSPITMLGGEAVRRFLDWQFIGPHSLSASGAFIENKCVGFYLGGIFRNPHTGFVHYNKTYLLWRVSTHPWLLANGIFRDAVKRGTRILQTPPFAESSPGKRRFRLLVIAVNPQHQRAGVGELLMSDAVANAHKYSFDQMYVTLDPENQRLIQWFQKFGFQLTAFETSHTGQMTKTLN